MFPVMCLVVRVFLLPLSSTKKDVLLWVLTVKKENAILLRRLRTRRKRAKFRFADRAFYAIVNMLREAVSSHFTIVKPETVLKWTRNLIKRYWGIKRSQGELMKAGIVLDTKTISKILRDYRRRGNLNVA